MDNDTMKAFKKLFEKLPDNIHRLVFFSPFTKYKVVNNNYANYVLRQFLAQLNIERILYTDYGTPMRILLFEGVNVSYVSNRLGHVKIETTFNNYIHVIKELEERDQIKTEKMLR